MAWSESCFHTATTLLRFGIMLDNAGLTQSLISSRWSISTRTSIHSASKTSLFSLRQRLKLMNFSTSKWSIMKASHTSLRRALYRQRAKTHLLKSVDSVSKEKYFSNTPTHLKMSIKPLVWVLNTTMVMFKKIEISTKCSLQSRLRRKMLTLYQEMDHTCSDPNGETHFQSNTVSLSRMSFTKKET